MVILDKRRIAMICTCVMLATFVFVAQTAKQPEVVETVALPVTNKVIVLDAGHRRTRWRSPK